jgi:hypothetical protein
METWTWQVKPVLAQTIPLARQIDKTLTTWRNCWRPLRARIPSKLQSHNDGRQKENFKVRDAPSGGDSLPHEGSSPAYLMKDPLHPSPEEKRECKARCLVQCSNSCFMDGNYSECCEVTMGVSQAPNGSVAAVCASLHWLKHSQCVGCCTVLWWPSGRKTRLPEGCSSWRKQH